jgi:hypothetical protein
MTTGLLEFFVLTRAERTVRAYTPPQHQRVRDYHDAADRRLWGARCVTQSVAAALLLRDAAACYLRAAAIARGGIDDGDSIAPADLAATMPEIPPDPARPGERSADDARVRAALVAVDPLYFDGLSAEDAARMRLALDRAASMLRTRVETRSLTNIRATRWGRILAIAVVLAYVAISGVRAAVLPKNIALHKPVIPSSVRLIPSDDQTIVDGELGFTFGIHTNTEDAPSVVVDLVDTYRVDNVRVHNRRDGWYDWCLPLVLELSIDGKVFKEIGRREEHFDADPPWVVQAHGQPARFVRVRMPHRGELALSEVEVFGKKM